MRDKIVLSTFQKALADIAQEQERLFRGLDENDELLAIQIAAYWSKLGKRFPGLTTSWSAVFVSFCVKSAGATKGEFMFSALNSEFVHAAIMNTESAAGVFHAFPVEECAPSVGDIIHNNRPGKKLTFNFASEHTRYGSHSAIVVATGNDTAGAFATTVGGNEGTPGSVLRRRVALDDDGMIIQRHSSPFISVIKTLK
jgi:hypothetical protein